jgi:hypothetical protein
VSDEIVIRLELNLTIDEEVKEAGVMILKELKTKLSSVFWF